MKKNLFLQAIILVTLFFVNGCATIYNPATGRDEIIFIDTRTEDSIGRSSAKQLSEKFKLSDDKQAIERLSIIGEHIAAVSDRQDLSYRFYLIEDDELNAFTIPGGHVYIHRGLYDSLSDDELASVLSHEIGHVAARHIVKRLQAQLGYQLLSTIALVTLTKDSKRSKKNSAYIAYAASTAFNLVSLGYSRKDEYEADELAIKYSEKGGYDPRGMVGALKKLDKKKQAGLSVPYILRSHPYIKDRIERIENLAN